MFRLEDVKNVSEIRSLDWKSARIVGSSDTHGVIVSHDCQRPNEIRIFLVGCGRNAAREANVKAHNSLSPAEARRLAATLLELANEAEGKPKRARA